MRFVTAITLLLAALLLVGGTQNRGPAADDPKGKAGGHHHMTGDMPKDIRMMNEMMVKHLGKKDAEYEKRFIDMMIPHHEGAILAAKNALENSNRPELKEMAKKSMEEQEKEIAKLKKWRKEWYGSEK